MYRKSHSFFTRKHYLISVICLSATIANSQSSKPYYLACSTSTKVDLWLIQESGRKATLLDTWSVPKGTWIEGPITTSPGTGVIVVPTLTDNPDTDPNDPNREGFYYLDEFKTLSTLKLSRSKLIPTNWGKVGYGYPILSPSGTRIAMVGDRGCYGYLDLAKRKKDPSLTDPKNETWVTADVWYVGRSANVSMHAVATWTRVAEDVSHYNINRFTWDGNEAKQSLQFKIPFTGNGVAVDVDGTLLTVNKTSIQRIYNGRKGITKQPLRSHSFSQVIGPDFAGNNFLSSNQRAAVVF